MAVNAVTVYGLTDYLIDKSMGGFNTSQSTLSGQMNALQAGLDATKVATDNQVATAKIGIGGEILALSSTLQSTNTQLATLNGTIIGIDKRLSESIARQQAFEAIMIRQRVLFGPPPNDNSKDSNQNLTNWIAAGFQGPLVYKADEVQTLNSWYGLSDPEK